MSSVSFVDASESRILEIIILLGRARIENTRATIGNVSTLRMTWKRENIESEKTLLPFSIKL